MSTTNAVPTLNRETLGTIATLVQKERCILFLGAAVNAPPPPTSPFAGSYPLPKRPMLGKDLTVRLAKRLMDNDEGLASEFRKECQQRLDRVTSLVGVEPISLREQFGRLTEASLDEDETNDLRNRLFGSLPELSRVALFYEKNFNRNELMDEIAAAVRGENETTKEPSQALKALAELPFPVVISTNYDNLFETALAGAGKPNYFRSTYNRNEALSARVSTEEPRDKPTARAPLVFKIHGDISEDPDSVVITDEDYIQFVLRMRDTEPYQILPQYVRNELIYSSVLFLGYRMMDYNLRLLLKMVRLAADQARQKTMYTVVRSPDPLLEQVFVADKSGVKFIVEDVWTYVPALYEAVMGRPLAPPPMSAPGVPAATGELMPPLAPEMAAGAPQAS